MSNNPRNAVLEEVVAANKLSDAISIAERNLVGVSNSFGGSLDQSVSQEVSDSLTFILGSSSTPTNASFFEQIFEQGLGNFFDNYKDLGSILNSFRSIYIPQEIAKNIASDVSDISKAQADLATQGTTNQSAEDIQKISAKKFLKESYENCFMRLMGLPTSDNIKNIAAYMDFGTGEVSTILGNDEVPFKVLELLDERQQLRVKKVENLDNTFYDVSKITIKDIDPFYNLHPSVKTMLNNAYSGALQLIQNEGLDFNNLNSSQVLTYFTRALDVISQQELQAGRQKYVIDQAYVESIQGKNSFRDIFEFLFYGKIRGLPILNIANELKSYSNLMFPTVQDDRIHKCIAERGKYIAPPFEHQTGFRINNDRPVMSFLEGILRIRLDKLSGYNPEQVVSLAKNSNTASEYRAEDVDGSYSVLESIMINRLVATLKICSKRLRDSCRTYVKNAIKSNITITNAKTPAIDPTTQNSQVNGSMPSTMAATKNIGKKNSSIGIQEESLKILESIEDSMVLLLGDTSKGLSIQTGTLRKSTITETPLMNILVSSITIPSKYIKKKRKKIDDKKSRTKEDTLENKKRDISSIIGIGRGVGILDALAFILAMLTVKESVLISMLTPRQFDNLKKEFGDSKFFEDFEISESFMSIENAVLEYSYQVNAAYDLFISFLKQTS
jgi:hypothetical protein